MIFYQKKLLSKDNITKSKNNYNPLINPVILLVCFLFVILVEITPFSKQINKQILGTTVNLQSEKIIELTNEQRQKNGLSVLKANDKLAQAALAKANDMFQFEYWDHFSPSKRSPWTFILNAGYDYHYAGENLAKDFDNAKDLVAAWMNSPNHKANILNSNYQDIGIAVVMGDFKGEETILIVQMFGTEFTPGEQYAVEQTRDNVEFKTTELLQASKIPWEKIVNDKFFLTKVIAMSVFLGFTITIFINLFSYYILKKPKPRKRQIWGHLIFLITFGILIILTSDGNII